MLDKNTLINRNKAFVIAVIRLIEQLPKSLSVDVFSRQLIRCSSSVGANYRAACRAKSTADFINKLKIVEEEADEAMYFLDLLKEVVKESFHFEIDRLLKEANELVAIYVSSIKKVRQNQKSVSRKS
jgi:four helix bundle protein